MTPDQQQKIIAIAEYDGWVKEVSYEISNAGSIFFHKKNQLAVPIERVNEWFKYHTSDEWLMPVTRKVWKELDHIFMSDELKSGIAMQELQELEFNAMQSIGDLFDEVYNAIELLNTFKAAK